MTSITYLDWKIEGVRTFPSLYHEPCGQVIVHMVNTGYDAEIFGIQNFKCTDCDAYMPLKTWNHLRLTWDLVLGPK